MSRTSGCSAARAARALRALCAMRAAVTMRDAHRLRLALPLLCAFLALASARDALAQPSGDVAQRSVFVLGIDGMDPVILQRLLDEGKLPHFAALIAEGGFQELATINPPQSPVAWSSFVTGMDPGGHGVFDFIHRDPATYTPIPSSTPPPEEPPGYLNLFGYIIPLGGAEAPNTRGGTPWWDILHDAGVQAGAYRMPGNFPVPPSDSFTLSGMGTVDLRGEFGKFAWYTDDAFTGVGRKGNLKADLVLVTVDDDDLDGRGDTVRTHLTGPPDVFKLKPGALPRRDQYLSVAMDIHVDPEQDVLWIRAGGAECVLREGEFSDWLQVSFDALPGGLMPVSGIVRFYAKSVRPQLHLYASPVNIDPSAPVTPIATPDGAAEALHAAMGFYATQGFPEEINALKDGLFDDDDYLKQVRLVHEEGERMLDVALDRFGPGAATFMYLSEIDLQCHMLWRHADPKHQDAPPHPGFDPQVSPKHALDIEDFYRSCDRVLGHVRSRLPAETLLLVISDHGFQAQTRQFHLNAWLRDQGYLVLNPAPPGEDGKSSGPRRTGHLTDVDWSATRAYGLGFNGLYLNLAGRERDGIVAPAQADALLAEIAAGLEALIDPLDGRRVVRSARRSRDIYSGSRVHEAPDLLVGYDAGFGCSDQSTLGQITEELLVDNPAGFTGNHLMDPDVVPGVLLSNRRILSTGHGLTDVTATLLQHFGVAVPADMVGRPIRLAD